MANRTLRPAGRPDGRVLGFSRCGGRFRCVLFRVGYTGRFRPVAPVAGASAALRIAAACALGGLLRVG